MKKDLKNDKKLRKNRTFMISALAFFFLVIIIFSFYFFFAKPGHSQKVEATLINGGGLPPGCVCHSKSKGMVKMHSYFSVTDCIKCHLDSENIMQKSKEEMTEEKRKMLESRIKSDEICQECHVKGKIKPVKIPESIAINN